ncbi:MAG: 3-oxoacyl-[acyl-carrier-protein] synthase III C-terminal domain-containing protein [Chloroflexota bacterium]
MMNSPQVISIGFAVPEKSYTQEEVFAVLKYSQRFWRVFKESGIEKRHLWVPPSEAKEASWQQQQDLYRDGAVKLSLQAINKCLDGRSAGDIACVVYGSCTGFAPGPTVAHYLAKELVLKPSTYYTNIIGQGCESGFPGLRRAYDFAVATGKKALVVNCELCSCTYYPEPAGRPNPENHFELLRSNALFADAASCALVGFDENPRHPFIIDMETYTNIDFINNLGYTWRDGRLRVLLSRRVPELAPQVVKPAVGAALQRQGLTVGDIQWWVIHAAGNTVLDNIRDALDIAEEKVTLSRRTLKEFGNTSSTSVGITGKRLMGEDIRPDDYAAVLSVGPGMTGGISLLRWLY